MLLDRSAGIDPEGSKIPALSVCRGQSCSPKCREVPGARLPWEPHHLPQDCSAAAHPP